MSQQSTQARPQVQAALETSDTPLLDKAVAETARRLDAVEALYRQEMSADGLRALHRALITSAAIERIEKLLPDAIMQRFMRLMNTSMGFKTDRGPHAKTPPYEMEVVRRVLIEALLKGFQPFNDEFQIIAGNFFGGQRGWKRLFEELPGVTEVEMIPGIPRVDNGQMCCRVACRWKYRGVSQELRAPDGTIGRVFPIQVNSHSNADNSTGKAVRKAYKAAWEQVTGQKLEGDEEPTEMLGTQTAPAVGKHDLKKNGQKPAASSQAEPMAPSAVETAKAVDIEQGFLKALEISKRNEAAELAEGELTPEQETMEAKVQRMQDFIAAAGSEAAVQRFMEEVQFMAEEGQISRSTSTELQGRCIARMQAFTKQQPQQAGRGTRKPTTGEP